MKNTCLYAAVIYWTWGVPLLADGPTSAPTTRQTVEEAARQRVLEELLWLEVEASDDRALGYVEYSLRDQSEEHGHRESGLYPAVEITCGMKGELWITLRVVHLGTSWIIPDGIIVMIGEKRYDFDQELPGTPGVVHDDLRVWEIASQTIDEAFLFELSRADSVYITLSGFGGLEEWRATREALHGFRRMADCWLLLKDARRVGVDLFHDVNAAALSNMRTETEIREAREKRERAEAERLRRRAARLKALHPIIRSVPPLPGASGSWYRLTLSNSYQDAAENVIVEVSGKRKGGTTTERIRFSRVQGKSIAKRTFKWRNVSRLECRVVSVEDESTRVSEKRCSKCGGSKQIRCTACYGKGRINCLKCSGTGRVRRTVKTGGGRFTGTRTRKVTCPTCHGTGGSVCNRCGGSKSEICDKCG